MPPSSVAALNERFVHCSLESLTVPISAEVLNLRKLKEIQKLEHRTRARIEADIEKTYSISADSELWRRISVAVRDSATRSLQMRRQLQRQEQHQREISEAEDGNTLARLPSSIICRVFRMVSNLPTIAVVCRRFCSLTHTVRAKLCAEEQQRKLKTLLQVQ